MKKHYLWAVPALVMLTGCTKNNSAPSDNQSKSKVIVEYLEAETVGSIIDGVSSPMFSEKGIVFSAKGESRKITTNMTFAGRDNFDKGEFKLYIDETDQQICTSEQSAGVTVEAYPLYNDNYSGVRVPNGDRRKVRYADDTEGYIPDSALAVAYPIAGVGYTAIEKYVATSPVLIKEITGAWFKIVSNVLDAYSRVEVAPYYAADGPLENRTKYTKLGEIQERFLNGGTTYIYVNQLNKHTDTRFTIEVEPNTTGQSRSFTLGFPYIAPWDGSTQYELFKVIQQ